MILVTGGLGQIATALSKLSGDTQFTALSRSNLDISNAYSVSKSLDFYKPRFVINAAAYTAVDMAEDNEQEAFLVNAKGPELLARACADRDIPLLHLSSDYVFSRSRQGSVGYFAEDDKPNPHGVYASSKHVGEISVGTELTKHVILRVCSVFSAHSRCFPRTILRAALRSGELKVVDDQVSGPTSAQSIALVIKRIVSSFIENGSIPWGTYHFSQQPFLSWYEFSKIIVSVASRKDNRFRGIQINAVSTSEFGAKAPRPLRSCLDSTKAREAFSLEPSLFEWRNDLDVAITQIIAEI